MDTMSAALQGLRQLTSRIGLNLSVWNASGEVVESLAPECEFCRSVSDANGGCELFSRQMAKKVLDCSESRTDEAITRCCILGVPIHQRRKQVGAAVACYPSLAIRDEEFLARLCDRLGLDRSVIAVQAERYIRHGKQEAADFLKILDWVLQREIAKSSSDNALETLSANLATTYEELSLLYRISVSMRVTQLPTSFLHDICDELLDVMNLEAVIAVSGDPDNEDENVTISGNVNLSESQIADLADKHLFPRFAGSDETIIENDFITSSGGRFGNSVRNLISTPLCNGDDEIPVALIGINKIDGDFDSVELTLMSAIGSQAAVFLANSRLFGDLQDLLMGVLHALTASLDAKDPYTCGHSQRVALIARRLAEKAGFDDERSHQLYLAGLLHDIGKIGVSENILRKEGRLTDEEYEEIKLHPMIGARILGGIKQLDAVASAILCHHERPDGGGYPRGLIGDEVPIEGMILSIADAFDAMTSARTYRGARSVNDAVEETKRCSGAQFDPELVDLFITPDLKDFINEIHEPAQTVFPLSIKTEEDE